MENPPPRPEGTITTTVRILNDRECVAVRYLDNYTPETFYANGANSHGVNVRCSEEFACLVKLAVREDNVSVLQQIRCWQTAIGAYDDQIVEAYGISFMFMSVGQALRTLASLVTRQANGQEEGPLITNGSANAMHIMVDGQLRWLNGYRRSDYRRWQFDANRPPLLYGRGYGWAMNELFFSRDSCL